MHVTRMRLKTVQSATYWNALLETCRQENPQPAIAPRLCSQWTRPTRLMAEGRKVEGEEGREGTKWTGPAEDLGQRAYFAASVLLF